MNRRQYLSRLAGTAGSVALLAGCTDDAGGLESLDGSSDGADSEDDASSDGDGSDAGSEEAATEIKLAVGSLNKAALSLSEIESQLDDPETVEFDASEPRTRIEEGRDHLETAAETATNDQQAVVEELRAYADVLAAIVSVADTLANGDIEGEVSTIRSAMADRRFEDARTAIESLRTTVADERDGFDPALETLETLDRELLESHDTVELDSIRRGAERLDAALGAVESLTAALESIVGGYERLETGRKRAEEDEAYDEAAAEFDAASDLFDEAATTLESGRETAPSGFDGYFGTLDCQTGELATASERFAEAANAMADDDPFTAREKRDEAEAAVERAENCGD